MPADLLPEKESCPWCGKDVLERTIINERCYLCRMWPCERRAPHVADAPAVTGRGGVGSFADDVDDDGDVCDYCEGTGRELVYKLKPAALQEFATPPAAPTQQQGEEACPHRMIDLRHDSFAAGGAPVLHRIVCQRCGRVLYDRHAPAPTAVTDAMVERIANEIYGPKVGPSYHDDIRKIAAAIAAGKP